LAGSARSRELAKPARRARHIRVGFGPSRPLGIETCQIDFALSNISARRRTRLRPYVERPKVQFFGLCVARLLGPHHAKAVQADRRRTVGGTKCFLAHGESLFQGGRRFIEPTLQHIQRQKHHLAQKHCQIWLKPSSLVSGMPNKKRSGYHAVDPQRAPHGKRWRHSTCRSPCNTANGNRWLPRPATLCRLTRNARTRSRTKNRRSSSRVPWGK
jgi:hypothetical protein